MLPNPQDSRSLVISSSKSIEVGSADSAVNPIQPAEPNMVANPSAESVSVAHTEPSASTGMQTRSEEVVFIPPDEPVTMDLSSSKSIEVGSADSAVNLIQPAEPNMVANPSAESVSVAHTEPSASTGMQTRSEEVVFIPPDEPVEMSAEPKSRSHHQLEDVTDHKADTIEPLEAVIDISGSNDESDCAPNSGRLSLRNSTSNKIAEVVAPYLNTLKEIARTFNPAQIRVAEAEPMTLCSTCFDPANNEMPSLQWTKKSAFLAIPGTSWQCPTTYRYAIANAIMFTSKHFQSGAMHQKTAFSMSMLKCMTATDRPHRFAIVFVGFTLCVERVVYAILFDFVTEEVIKGWIPFEKRKGMPPDCPINLNEYYCDVEEPLYKPDAGRTVEPKEIWSKGLQYLSIFGFIFRKERLIHIDSETAYKKDHASGVSDFARSDAEAEYCESLTPKEREDAEAKVVERANLFRLKLRDPKNMGNTASTEDGKTRSQRKRISGALNGETLVTDKPLERATEKSSLPARASKRRAQTNKRMTVKPKAANGRNNRAGSILDISEAPSRQSTGLNVSTEIDELPGNFASRSNESPLVPCVPNSIHQRRQESSVLNAPNNNFYEGVLKGQEAFLEHLKKSEERLNKNNEAYQAHFMEDAKLERDHKRKLEEQSMADSHKLNMIKIKEERKLKKYEIKALKVISLLKC